MQAMILAAGFGTRLLPFTRFRPKPLFPILNEPLLILTIRRLQNYGFDHIIVNCHHLREQVADTLAAVSGVTLQQEDTILGTGGGLRQALGLMRDEPLLVSNGDIYHSIDYGKLYRRHLEGNSPVTMAMHDYPRYNKVTVKDSLVRSFDAGEDKYKMAFTGLHVLDPQILTAIPYGRKSCIIDRYRRLIADGETIQAFNVSDASWTDMGTVADYLALHGGLLGGKFPLWKEFIHKPAHGFLIDRRVDHRKLKLRDWACVGNADFQSETEFCRCVVWDGAYISSVKKFTDKLITPDMAE